MEHSHVTDVVTIVGAGMAGAACAVALRDAGIPVRVLDQGKAPGGRMASPVLHGRRVDLGAGYFTVRDNGFQQVVAGWAAAGLAREWTDTFGVLAVGRPAESKAGPVRWATRGGLRSLVRAMLDGIDVVSDAALDRLPSGDVVLAMPDPQAARLALVPDPVEYGPAIAVACGFASRDWPFSDAAFVVDHPDLEFLADDGARRGDGAAVLVVHTTAARARRHLDHPDGAIAPVVSALRELLGVASPLWTHAHRWTFAKPAGQHQAAFALLGVEHRRLGLAGDQWCPQGRPRVESAWRSGTDLAAAIIATR